MTLPLPSMSVHSHGVAVIVMVILQCHGRVVIFSCMVEGMAIAVVGKVQK
jgi:hypothetical protein